MKAWLNHLETRLTTALMRLSAPFSQDIPPLDIQHPIRLILSLEPKPHKPVRKRWQASLSHTILASGIFACSNDFGLVESGCARVQGENLVALC